MTAIGADPEALRDLSRRFRKLHGQLETSRAALDRHLRNAGWHGHDAERFRRNWTLHHRGELLRTAELCRLSATDLLRQAEEQIRVSESAPADTRATSAPTRGGPVGAGSQVDVPSSIVELSAGAQVTVASVLLGVTHDIRVETLPGGRSLVTFTKADRAGAEASFGASIHVVSQRAVGASASAGFSLGAVERRSFLVDSDDVWEVIAAVELQDAAGRVVDAASKSSSSVAVGAIGSIGGWLLGRIPASARKAVSALVPEKFRPVPDATETLAELHVDADASLLSVPLVGPSASLGAEYLIRAGRSEGPVGPASIFEIEGSVAAEVKDRLLGEASYASGNRNDHTAAPTLRVEIPDTPADGSRRAQMTVTSTVTDGITVRRSISRVDISTLVGAGLVADARRVLDSLAAGNPVEAYARLTQLHVSGDSVTTTVATFTTDSRSGTVGGEAGEGISVGLDLDAGVTRLSRTT